MKQPSLKDLKRNREETTAVQKGMRKSSGSVKITINIDADSLNDLRRMAEKTGVPYQRLLNTLLRKTLSDERASENRLERLEREVERLKKKLVA